jgi:hypothetical protein
MGEESIVVSNGDDVTPAQALRHALGPAVQLALLYIVGTAGLTMAIVGDPTQYPAMEHAMGQTMSEVATVWTEHSGFGFELAEEARRLSTHLGYLMSNCWDPKTTASLRATSADRPARG